MNLHLASLIAQAAVLCALVCPSAAEDLPYGGEPADGADYVGLGGSPVSVVCSRTYPTDWGGDAYEVYQGSLDEVPLAIEVGIHAYGTDYSAKLHVDTRDWYQYVGAQCIREPDRELKLELIPGTERIRLAERSAQMNWQLSGDIPQVLPPGDAATALFRLVRTDGTSLEPGLYHIRGVLAPGATEFFGAPCGVSLEFQLRVKPRTGGDDDDFIEERVERLRLWGTQLQLWDIEQGEALLQQGLALVKKYIADGAGDSEGTYNITPRYQAALLLMRLGQKREALAYLQTAYSKGAGADNCKWQAYHFIAGADSMQKQGPMPNQVKDTIYSVLSRLYLEVYGRPIYAQPQAGAGD
jgi:hypothetical protein